MDAYPTPFYERPPLFFSQQQFRKHLFDGPENPIKIFKNALNGADIHLNDRFREGDEIASIIHERASFIDCILHYAWHRQEWSSDVAMIAVGGYGRGELHPQSDIDLLILMRQENQKDLDSAQSLLLFLWDIGLNIGHSVRTLEQCVEIAADDITVATNIMECRTIAGNPRLCIDLRLDTLPGEMWPADQFLKAKWQEQKDRHQKYNNTEHNLEPNVKNAPGGLRDIQTVNWVAKRHFGVTTLQQLSGKDFFTEHEFAVLLSGEEFLWRVRYGIHRLAGRAEERLLFDYQRQLAKEFGYKDTDRHLAVEQFMRRYYRVVQALRELNDVLLHFLDDAVLNRNGDAVITPINERFQLRDSYIEVTSNDVFRNKPSAMLEIFVHMGKRSDVTGISPATIRLLRENRVLINDEFRANPVNQQHFIAVLRDSENVASVLRKMARYNILARYLPEFGKITGQMQHDLFHIYTVDQHTLAVIENINSLKTPAGREKFPQAHYCLQALPKLKLLYIAGLYHDIAKGRGGDHSTLGAVDALDFCERHGLKKHEGRLVAWMVEKHLLMSTISQKRDLADPDVIREFALQMGDQTHLNYLFVLTVADINATNPTLWNTWRASLMRQLYNEATRVLRRGLENPVDKTDIIEESQESAMKALVKLGIDPDNVRSLWSYLGDDYFLHEHSRDIIWQSEAIIRHNSQDDLILVRETTSLKHEGATEIFIRTKDRSNVFVAVASALDQLNLSIQDARIYNTDRGGYTIDTFYVLNHNNEPIGNDPEFAAAIRNALNQALQSTTNYGDTIKRLTPRQLKNFPIPTRATISNDIRTNATLLEVITPDRPGLLATIARIFFENDVHLTSAKITTLGERVEDIFYIADSKGNPLSDPALCDHLQAEIRTRLDQQVVGSDAI